MDANQATERAAMVSMLTKSATHFVFNGDSYTTHYEEAQEEIYPDTLQDSINNRRSIIANLQHRITQEELRIGQLQEFAKDIFGVTLS